MPTTTFCCRVFWGMVALSAVAWWGCSSKEPGVEKARDGATTVSQPVSPSPESKPVAEDATVRRAALPASAPEPTAKTTKKIADSPKSPPKWVMDYEPSKPATSAMPATSPTSARPDLSSRRPAAASLEPSGMAPPEPGLNPNPLRGGRSRGFELAPSAPPVAGQVPAPAGTPAGVKPSGTAGRAGYEQVVPLSVDGGKTDPLLAPGRTSRDSPSMQLTPPSPTTLSAREAAPNAIARAAAPGGSARVESPAKGESRHPPFDPIKENGSIFVDWGKPKLALVITGREDGYLEPCGCAGLDRMKGGLSRRHTLLRQLREQGWPVIAVDVGGNSKGFGRQAQLKFNATVEALKIMGYDAIGLGASELQLPADELLSVVAGAPQQPSPFVSANVGLFGFDASITPQKHVIKRGGFNVGITSILGKTFQKQINNPDIAKADPEESLAKMAPELKKECNLLILLAHATLDESIALANKFPAFDVVVTAGGPAGEPPRTLSRVPGGKAALVEVGDKGMNAVVLGLFEDPEPEKVLRYQRVPLDSRFAASPEMQKIMADYQMHVERLGLAGLGIKPMPHPSAETMGAFVGSAKCKSCHEKSYDIWKKTGHAKAYPTLANLKPPRQFDPECISCHVVGWHPQQFFPYEGGYVSIEKTPHLADAGCESCHGPGELHVKAEMGADAALQAKLQKAVRVTKEEAEKHLCLSCHDGDNSPDFQFKSYWPKVEHKE